MARRGTLNARLPTEDTVLIYETVRRRPRRRDAGLEHAWPRVSGSLRKLAPLVASLLALGGTAEAHDLCAVLHDPGPGGSLAQTIRVLSGMDELQPEARILAQIAEATGLASRATTIKPTRGHGLVERIDLANEDVALSVEANWRPFPGARRIVGTLFRPPGSEWNPRALLSTLPRPEDLPDPTRKQLASVLISGHLGSPTNGQVLGLGVRFRTEYSSLELVHPNHHRGSPSTFVRLPPGHERLREGNPGVASFLLLDQSGHRIVGGRGVDAAWLPAHPAWPEPGEVRTRVRAALARIR